MLLFSIIALCISLTMNIVQIILIFILDKATNRYEISLENEILALKKELVRMQRNKIEYGEGGAGAVGVAIMDIQKGNPVRRDERGYLLPIFPDEYN